MNKGNNNKEAQSVISISYMIQRHADASGIYKKILDRLHISLDPKTTVTCYIALRDNSVVKASVTKPGYLNNDIYEQMKKQAYEIAMGMI